MSWRDRYREASFRGVPFLVERTSALVGRRLFLHEYPGRDLPFVEDLGRRARAFQVDGYLVGEDYDLDRDRMLAACEQTGPGTLVHPYLGTVRVTLDALELTETREEGRLCRFRFAFLEAGEELYPEGELDVAARTAGAADAADLASSEGLASRLKITGKPAFVLDAITDAARVAERYLTSLTYGGPAGPVRQLLDAVEGLADRVIDLLFDPELLAGDLLDTVRRVRDGYVSRAEAIKALDGLHELDSPTAEGIGALQADAAANARAVLDHLAMAAVSDQARLATELELESLDQAEALRALLEGRLDALELRVGDGEVEALEALRGALGAALPPPDSDLPRRATVVPSRAVPSLVLAYELWDAPEREGELAARNMVRHPGFLPAGEPLEVLSA